MNNFSLKPIASDYVRKAEDKKSNRGQSDNDVERAFRSCSPTRRARNPGPAATTMMTRASEFNARRCVNLSAACASDFVVLMMWTVTGSMSPA
jgi:hypothetical protein